MKSIIFNAEMVKAILDGRKTQFRMPIKLKDNTLTYTGYVVNSTDKKRCGKCSFGINKEQDLEYVKPIYKVGDVLYVKETFQLGDDIRNIQNIPLNEDIEVLYYEDEINSHNSNNKDFAKIIKWKPSIHMPKKYARIFLKVTNVRVERLQDISNDDIYSESIKRYSQKDLKKAFDNNELQKLAKCLKLAFINLWNSTAKDGYNWEDNPYVFVYEFKRIEK